MLPLLVHFPSMYCVWLDQELFCRPYFAAWFDKEVSRGWCNISEYYHSRSRKGFARFTLISWGTNWKHLPLKLMIVNTFVITFGDLMFLGSVTKWITSLFASIGWGWRLNHQCQYWGGCQGSLSITNTTVPVTCHGSFDLITYGLIEDPLINWTVSNIDQHRVLIGQMLP